MSFILDALRKSESERQREAAPGFARAPLATVRRETPAWIWLAMGLLTAALAAVAFAWWQSDRRDGGPATAAGPEPAAAPGTATPPAAAGVRTNTAQAGAAAGDRGQPRPISELTRTAPGLPRYSLDFVAYNSADPAGGSAWINGERYRPGERIGGGPELIEVRPDSVILAYAGERYLLSAR